MDYNTPDNAERWLKVNDDMFGKGEYSYLSQWQLEHPRSPRRKKEVLVNPNIIDSIDFSVVRNGNYGTKGHLSTMKKDRHKQGQKDTDLW